MPDKLRVLVIIDDYLSGHYAGGTVRALTNLIETLGDEFEFSVLTVSKLDQSSTLDAKTESRQRVGKAEVTYLGRSSSLSSLTKMLHPQTYDVIYLSSLFARLCIKVSWLLKLGLIPKTTTIIAPHGELHTGALSLHPLRKHLYIRLAKLLHLYHKALWHATSDAENERIHHFFGDTQNVFVAPVLRTIKRAAQPTEKPIKQSGTAEAIFLSRIARNKNLDMALRVLQQVSGTVHFDIYGPIEDADYWQDCQAIIQQLPANIQVQYKGIVTDAAVEVFAKYHLFLFPTRGESFSFAILEALFAGCLLITSDQTPWRNLATSGAGWDIALTDQPSFITALNTVVNMDAQEFNQRSKAAVLLAKSMIDDPEPIQRNSQLFFTARELAN